MDMKMYKVEVIVYCPAPRRREYIIDGSNESVVASRGLKKMRKDEAFKGRKIEKWQVNISR